MRSSVQPSIQAFCFRDLRTSLGTVRSGRSRVSVDRVSALTLVAESDIDSITSIDLEVASAIFHGDRALDWAGLLKVAEKLTAPKGRVQRLQLDARSQPAVSASLSDGVELELSAHWEKRDLDRGLVIDTGLRVTAASSRSGYSQRLLETLLSVQDLLGIAFGGHYAVTEGQAQPLGVTERRPFWFLNLMGPSATPHADRGHAVFSLDDIGGVKGLGRWVHLQEHHPRATRSITSVNRHGGTSPEVHTLELGAAIEYWVKHNRAQGRLWARKVKRSSYVAVLARYVGKPFETWVRDPERWSAIFWDHYNGLKHRPQYSYSRKELAFHAEAAHQLLTAGLLLRVAPSKMPARRVFEDHRIARLGQELIKLL